MKNKWILLVFLCMTFVLYTVDRALLGPLAIPIQSDTGLTDVQFGLLNAAVFWTYAAFVPFAGYLGDRFDRMRLIGVASVAWSAMTLLAGFASGFWSLLVLVAFAVTLPQTIYSPSAAALLAERHQTTRTVALSAHQAAFYVGWLSSGLAVAAILSAFGSWRAAYWTFGGVGMLLGFVFLLTSRQGTCHPQFPVRTADGSVRPTFAEAMRAFWTCPSAVIAAVGHVAFTFAAFGYTSWGPKFVALKFGLSPKSAGAGVMFWHFVAALLAVFVTGFLTDRFVRRWPRIRLELQTSALLLSVPALAVFGWCSTLCGVWISAALFGIMKGSFEANSFNSVFDVVPGNCRASAVGYVNVLGGVVGSLAPVILGWLSQRFGVRGLETGFFLMGTVLVGAALLMSASLFFTFKRDRIVES